MPTSKIAGRLKSKPTGKKLRRWTAARSILREHLVTDDGETRLATDAAQVAIAHLTERGTDPEDAADYVTEATADVLRQLEGRAADRQRNPVAEAKAELAEAGRPSILAALYDERLVDDAGFMVLPDNAPGLYRKYRIDPKAKNAATLMRLEIRDQMFTALNARVSWVVLDGEAKWAIRGGNGEAVRLWKEATIAKLFINRGVSYWEGDGDKAKVKTIKPSDVITFARQRDTFLDTCFEPDPAKAAIAARPGAVQPLERVRGAAPSRRLVDVARPHPRPALRRQHGSFQLGDDVACLDFRPGPA